MLHLVRHGRPLAYGAPEVLQPLARALLLAQVGQDADRCVGEQLSGLDGLRLRRAEPRGALRQPPRGPERPDVVEPAGVELPLGGGDAGHRRAFARPDEPAAPGWEPLSACGDRVVPAVRRVLEVHPGQDVVLVGHGTAWTVVVAALTDEQPDLDRWASLDMPDVLVVPA